MHTLQKSAAALPGPTHGGWVPLSAAPGLASKLARGRAGLAGTLQRKGGGWAGIQAGAGTHAFAALMPPCSVSTRLNSVV